MRFGLATAFAFGQAEGDGVVSTRGTRVVFERRAVFGQRRVATAQQIEDAGAQRMAPELQVH